MRTISNQVLPALMLGFAIPGVVIGQQMGKLRLLGSTTSSEANYSESSGYEFTPIAQPIQNGNSINPHVFFAQEVAEANALPPGLGNGSELFDEISELADSPTDLEPTDLAPVKPRKRRSDPNNLLLGELSDSEDVASPSDEVSKPTPAPTMDSEKTDSKLPMWRLSLAESVQVGLSNNRDIAVFAPAPTIAATLVAIQRAEFDPVAGVSTFGGQDERQVRSLIATFGAPAGALKTDYFTPNDGLNQVYLRQRLMNGGSYDAGFGSVYQRFDPAGPQLLVPSGWETALRLRYVQPLLRGAGADVVTAPLRIAQAQTNQSKFEFLAQVRTIVRDIDLAYWELAGGYRKEIATAKYVELAEAFYREEEERQKLGFSAKPQLVQARSLVAQFKVANSLAKQEAAVAEMRLRKQLGLAEYIYRPDSVMSMTDFELPIRPAIDRSRTDENTDLDVAIVTSMSRPELLAQQHLLEGLSYAVVAAKNGVLPDVKAYTLYQSNGLSKGLEDSLSTALGGSFQTWGAGLSYEQRILLRSERANLRRVQLLIGQERARQARISHDIVAELRVAKANIENLRQVIEDRVELVESFGAELAVLDELYRDGKATLFQRLDTSRALQFSEIDLIDSWRELQLSLAQWRYARGDTAGSYNVAVEGMPSQSDLPAPTGTTN